MNPNDAKQSVNQDEQEKQAEIMAEHLLNILHGSVDYEAQNMAIGKAISYLLKERACITAELESSLNSVNCGTASLLGFLGELSNTGKSNS